jgi:hypothetical protein
VTIELSAADYRGFLIIAILGSKESILDTLGESHGKEEG